MLHETWSKHASSTEVLVGCNVAIRSETGLYIRLVSSVDAVFFHHNSITAPSASLHLKLTSLALKDSPSRQVTYRNSTLVVHFIFTIHTPIDQPPIPDQPVPNTGHRTLSSRPPYTLKYQLLTIESRCAGNTAGHGAPASGAAPRWRSVCAGVTRPHRETRSSAAAGCASS